MYYNCRFLQEGANDSGCNVNSISKSLQCFPNSIILQTTWFLKRVWGWFAATSNRSGAGFAQDNLIPVRITSCVTNNRCKCIKKKIRPLVIQIMNHGRCNSNIRSKCGVNIWNGLTKVCLTLPLSSVGCWCQCQRASSLEPLWGNPGRSRTHAAPDTPDRNDITRQNNGLLVILQRCERCISVPDTSQMCSSNINLIKVHHNSNICFLPGLSLFLSFISQRNRTFYTTDIGKKISKDCYLLSDGLEKKTLSDLSTAEKSLCVGWVYLQGFVAVFQGFVWAVQTELGDRKVQEERKQRRPDPVLLCFSLCLSVLQQHQCLSAKHWSQYKISYFCNAVQFTF